MSFNQLASLKAAYTRHLQNEEEDFLLSSNNQGGSIQPSTELLPQLKSYLKSVLTEAEYQGICWHETNEYENIAFPKTEDRPHLTGYGNLCRINDIRRINKYFRSEEHTSELQSRGHLVCRLLLEKKKQNL